jgi:photosystem I subunit VI
MASLAAVSVQPVAVKGLAGSSISGRRLAVVRPSPRAACRSARRPRGAAVVAKYGDKSVYFDLDDIGNTTGQWDLYGSDAPSPYNPLQVPTRRYATASINPPQSACSYTSFINLL